MIKHFFAKKFTRFVLVFILILSGIFTTQITEAQLAPGATADIVLGAAPAPISGSITLSGNFPLGGTFSENVNYTISFARSPATATATGGQPSPILNWQITGTLTSSGAKTY